MQFWSCLLLQPRLTNTPRDGKACLTDVCIRNWSKARLKENEGQLEEPYRKSSTASHSMPEPCTSIWRHTWFLASTTCASAGLGREFVREGTRRECLKVKFIPIHRPLSSTGLQTWEVYFSHCLGAVSKRLLNLGRGSKMLRQVYKFQHHWSLAAITSIQVSRPLWFLILKDPKGNEQPQPNSS